MKKKQKLIEKLSLIDLKRSMNSIKKFRKNAALQSLFDRDFQYLPLIEFEKKYRCYITRRTNKYSGIISETYGK